MPPVLVSLLVNDMLTPFSHVELAVYEDEGRHIGIHGLPADAALSTGSLSTSPRAGRCSW